MIALPDWCGASSATNIDAELQAMVVAQLVCVIYEVGCACGDTSLTSNSGHDLAARRVGARKESGLFRQCSAS